MASIKAPVKKRLLITTLENSAKENKILYEELTKNSGGYELITTKDKKIHHCIGCNDCWIKTPGLCCIKDDYEQILIKMLQADTVVFLTSVQMGFVSSGMKNLIDRILPLATMHLHFKIGQMRHYSRYHKIPDMSLVYLGTADNEYLNLWMKRVQVNLDGISLGAYEFNNRRELYHALTHH